MMYALREIGVQFVRRSPEGGTPSPGLRVAGLRPRRVGPRTVGLLAAMAAGMLVWGSPAVAATQQLQSSLLTIQNLPPGWSKTNGVTATTKSCYSNPIWKLAYKTKASAAFRMNDSVPQLVEQLASYANANAAYKQVVAGLNRCSSFSESVQGQKLVGTISPISNKRFGNESSSYTANLSVQGTQLDQEFVIARKGSTLAAVAVGDYGAVDSQLLNQLTTKAMRLIPA
jgi:hypothetical protein